MKEQTLALRPDEPIGIKTPLGYILLEQVERPAGKGFRQLKITMPGYMEALVLNNEGKKKTLMESSEVKIDGGKVVPLFNLLSPLVDKDGQLIGVVSPGTLRLEEHHVEDVVHPEPGQVRDLPTGRQEGSKNT